MTANIPTVLTPEEVAERTRTSPEAICAELEAGRLRGFKIGGEWRVTADQLVAFMTGEANQSRGGRGEQRSDAMLAALSEVEWKSRDQFAYTWPDGKTTETYDTAYEADVEQPSGRHHFVIGYTTRRAAGMDRPRVIVFLGEVPQIVPVVEFAGENDFEATHRLASVIKHPDGHHVRSEAQLPSEYEDLPTAMYPDLVAGPYAARSMAVVAHNDDWATMLRHALIRARYKGWL